MKVFEIISAIKRKCIITEEKIRKELNLSPGEYHGLLVLQPNENILACTFAERMGLSPSRGSRVLGALNGNGYITLEQKPENRRNVYIALTEKGIAEKNKIKQHLDNCEKNLLAAFSTQQAQKIKEALTLLEKAL